jgi:PAS domain S-box-containing protein
MPVDGDQPINRITGIANLSDDAFHESIYDFFPGLVYVYDTDKGKLRYVNKKITEALGFTYEDVQSWDRDFGKLVFKDDFEAVKAEIEKFHAVKDNDIYGYKCRFNRKGGDYLHFQVTGKVLRRTEQGKALSILFVAQDINEQIRAAEEAKTVKELLDDTENLLQFATWSWSAATDKTHWSHGVYALLNYRPNDPAFDEMKVSFMDHVVPADRKRVEALYEKAVNNKVEFLSYEFSIVTHNSETKVIRSNIKFRYADGKLIGVFGINRDISEKSKLLTSLLGYREMIMEKENFLGHGTWELDLVSQSMTWSDGMYQLFGYDPKTDKEKVVLDETIYKKHINGDDYVKGTELATELQEKGGNYVWQFGITTHRNEPKQIESFGKVVKDAAGKAVRVIGTSRDVTKIVQYEQELERKIDDLRRSNKDLEDFAYVASHDMHEPLRKVHSFADRLKMKYSDALPDEGRGYLDRILSATQNARLMIDGLMEFSRLSRKTEVFEEASLTKIAAEVVADLELKVEETGAKIDIGTLPELEVIPIQIRQLLSNIILNAIKFRRPDVAPEIDIRSKKLTKQETLRQGLDGRQEYYSVTVKDNGIGFENQYAETIFQMFQRLNSKSDYPGSGIGLALCKKIIENHHGSISAYGVPGKGATFTFTLPTKNS